MTQEQINELRKAISEVLIPHEWRAESAAQAITEVFVDAGGGQWSIASTQDLPKCLFPANANYPVFRHSQRDAIARYIAAANPAAILALIAEIDSLRDEVNGLTGELGRERERLDWAVSRESFYDHTTRILFCDRAFKIPNPQVRIETDNFRATIDELMVQS